MKGFVFLLLLAGFVWWFCKKKATKKPEAKVITFPSIPQRIDRNEENSFKVEPEKDAWEGSFWEVQEPFPVKATLQLDYQDANAQRTIRTVSIRKFGDDGRRGLLIGHCHLRDDIRTFRVDRIKQCVDQETGEIIEDVHSYLRQKYENSPEYRLSTFVEAEYDTLRVLFFVGKADGRLMAVEKAIICETCYELANESGITVDALGKYLAELDVPSLQAFKLAVGRLSIKPQEHKSLLYEAAKRIVGTQKTVHPSEQAALDYMAKKLFA